MNSTIIAGYIKNIIFTFIVALFCAIGLFAYMINSAISEDSLRQAADNEVLDFYTINILIEKNKYLESKSPDNYIYNSKLGLLYELKKDYTNAEVNYKLAIEKVPYHIYKPYYDLSMFYIKLNRLITAENCIEKLGEKPVKTLVKYKAEIYTKLGDKYYDLGDYVDASLKYQEAYNYYKVLKDKKKLKELKANLASAYVYLAFEEVIDMNIDNAIEYLNQAKELINDPLIRYRLALLYTKTNPELAEQYFEEVFKEEPQLINYDSITEFYKEREASALEYDDSIKAKLYEFKINKMKKYYVDNLLSTSDLAIEKAKGHIIIKPFRKKFKVELVYDIKNISKYNINSLFLFFVFKNKGKEISRMAEEIISSDKPLKPNDSLPLTQINSKLLDYPDKLMPKEITVEIYAAKSADSYRIMIKELKIKRSEKSISLWEKVFHRYLLPNIGF